MRLLEKRLEEQVTRASSAPIPQVVSVLEVFSQTGEKDSLRRQLESEPNVWGNPGHQTSKRLQLWCLLVLLCHCTCMEIAIRCPKISTKIFRPPALLNKSRDSRKDEQKEEQDCLYPMKFPIGKQTLYLITQCQQTCYFQSFLGCRIQH